MEETFLYRDALDQDQDVFQVVDLQDLDASNQKQIQEEDHQVTEDASFGVLDHARVLQVLEEEGHLDAGVAKEVHDEDV